MNELKNRGVNDVLRRVLQKPGPSQALALHPFGPVTPAPP